MHAPLAALEFGAIPKPKSGDERLVPTPSRQKVLRSLQDLETRISKTKEMQIWSFHQLRHPS